ncbi:hypothetical protein TNCT_311101, partial [Trichonephila clavata]
MLTFTIYILLLPAAGRDVVVCFPETKSGWLGHKAKFECRAVKTPHLTRNALAWYCKYAASTECGLCKDCVRITPSANVCFANSSEHKLEKNRTN